MQPEMNNVYSPIYRKTKLPAIIIVALLLLANVSAKAQAILYNDGGTLHTDANSILHIEGDIENRNTSVIENDGTIELVGNLTNDSTAQLTNGSDNTSTERAYKFVGPGTQLISGSFSDITNRYIHNLIIDKQSSGSVVEMQADVHLTGSLVFGSSTSGADTYAPTTLSSIVDRGGQGIIKTYDGSGNDYDPFVTNASENAVMGYAPLVINGAPADGYIENRGAQGVGAGGFSRNVTNEGVAYVFPVGSNANGYNGAALTFSALGAHPDKIRNMFVDATGGVGQIRSSCVGCNGWAADNAGFNYYFDTNPCNGNAPQWVILDVLPTDHGYWSFSGNMSDQYVIETYPNSFPAFAGSSVDNWRMIKKSGPISGIPTGDWNPEILSAIQDPSELLTFSRNTGCYSGTGVPGGTFTGFSHFQVASSHNNALPVEMLYITAQAIDNQFIRVNWATGVEINNQGFKVMRSTDGVNFNQIGWVDNKTGGNSTTETAYLYNDMNVQSGIVYYYRLVQVDFDGASKETQIVNASINGIETQTTLTEFFPNPASSSTSIIINAAADQKFNVTLYNMTGQLLLQNEINAAAGSSRYNFSTGQLAQGNYKAVIKSDKQVFTRNLNIIK